MEPDPGLGSWSGILAKVCVKMSSQYVIWPLGSFVGRQSVVMVGGWVTASGKPPALGSWAAWRALGESCQLVDALSRGHEVATYSRTAYSSGLMSVGLGAISSDREGGVGAAGSRSLARVKAAAYTAEKRQSAVSFMLGVVWCLEVLIEV